MSTKRWYLRVRRYPEGDTQRARFVTVHLVCADGPAHASLLWGEVLPGLVPQIAQATGLSVEEEAQPLAGMEPLTPHGCAPVARQAELFG